MMNHENEQERAAMERIRERLNNHIAKLAMSDYKAAGNPKYNRKGERVHIPYGLRPETNEAREVYHIALKGNWTDEEENRIKTYQMQRITFA